MKLKLVLISVLFSTLSYAQEFKANLNDLSFMSGTWTVKHEWGDMEEFWGPPMGNCMISSYRCVKDGKVLFYEFVVIEQGDQVPVLKLRHFNPGSIGWEEKDAPMEYPLISLSNKTAVFQSLDKSVRLTYQLLAGKLEIVLEEVNKKNEVEKTRFSYNRKP